MRWDGLRAELERCRREVGLCLDCRNLRVVTADGGAVRYECQHADVDLAYPQYPQLPVRECSAYQPGAETLPD